MAEPENKLRVAIVHDWLIGGGAERVVQELRNLYPQAPIYTSYCSKQWRKKLGPVRIVTGPLQVWPLSHLRKYLPLLRAWWFTHLDLAEYDVVISSSGAEAKFVKVPEGAKHIAYIHAPTHYYWSRYDEYLKSPGFGVFDWLARAGLKVLVGPLRRLDYQAAQRPDILIANSAYTRAQIKKYYGRESTVIHPPVDIGRFQDTQYNIQDTDKRKGYVVAGRQTPYKRIDLAVAACTQLNLLLTVIGSGPDHKKLVKIAGPTITFLTNTTDEDMVIYFRSAEAFIFPGLDDFGIVAVEALVAGTPVIAYKAGGALDYVVPGKTGVFFGEQTVDSLISVLKNFDAEQFDPVVIKQYAQQFNELAFKSSMVKLVNANEQ